MQRNYVLDTNIWVSATISKKIAPLITKIANNSNVHVFACPELFEEISEVLNRPHLGKYINRPVSAHVKIIKGIATEITIKKGYQRAPDPKDNYLYDLCLQTKSTLVTGDKALLAYISKPVVKTITYNTFLKAL